MSSEFRSKDFKKLKAQWDKKLAASGFEDAEYANGVLKLFHVEYFSDPRRHSDELIKGKQNYFRLAGQFLYSHEFETTTDKLIWQLHADGQSVREIAAYMKKKRVPYCKRAKIQNVVKRLEKLMIDKEMGRTK